MPTMAKKSKEKKEEPKKLRPFRFLGLDLSYTPGETEATADCPFCGKEEKFSVKCANGLWKCFVCSKSGGVSQFLQEWYEHCLALPSEAQEAKLIEMRGISSDDISVWGFAFNPLTGDWMLPGLAKDSNDEIFLKQLYRYTWNGQKKRYFWLPCPDQKHTLFGLDQWEDSSKIVWICEGVWDAIELERCLGTFKLEKNELIPCDYEDSLAASSNVVAVPGCQIFHPEFLRWLRGKDRQVRLVYDSDHPKKLENGVVVEPAGFLGVQRASSALVGSVKSVEWFSWSPEGFDPSLKSGYDFSDLVENAGPRGALTRVLDALEPASEDWAQEFTDDNKLRPVPCSSYEDLTTSWKKAMRFTDGLDYGLSVMLASIASTAAVGDQLWIRIIGPPSCGKSTLCEAVSVSSRYIIPKSTLRGFHSGFNVGGEDHSLISKVAGRTLVVKDGDTILQAPNRSQILSEARDMYDCVSRSDYRNGAGRDYEGIRMTWILCGTPSLRELDESELGARFIDCIVMEGIDDDEEDIIVRRKALRSIEDLDIESSESAESQNNPALIEAMQLSGGYVEHLRNNAFHAFPSIGFPESAIDTCCELGKLVSYLRARPSVDTEDEGGRELSARLVSQFARLAKCLAFVLNRSTVDEDVLERVRKVALHTARGPSLAIVKELLKPANQKNGISKTTLRMYVERPKDPQMTELLLFLKKLGVLQVGTAAKGRNYRLTDKFKTLALNAGVTPAF